MLSPLNNNAIGLFYHKLSISLSIPSIRDEKSRTKQSRLHIEDGTLLNFLNLCDKITVFNNGGFQDIAINVQKYSGDDTLEFVQPVAAVDPENISDNELQQGWSKSPALLIQEFPDMGVEVH